MGFMCNLYTMTRSVDEVARLFDAAADAPGNAGDTVYPGYPGYVVAEGRVRQMTWGFPLAIRGKSGQLLKPKPINNTRTNKLESGFWRPSFHSRRCLIPVTGFCEPQGEKGSKTRTWFSLPDEQIFAVAGIWRDTAEWGLAYSMVMTDACAHVQGVHDRMPAILPQRDWTDWLNGAPDAAGILCRPYEADMTVKPTSESWINR